MAPHEEHLRERSAPTNVQFELKGFDERGQGSCPVRHDRLERRRRESCRPATLEPCARFPGLARRSRGPCLRVASLTKVATPDRAARDRRDSRRRPPWSPLEQE